MSHCRDYERLLMKRMDRDLSATDERRLSEHLETCPDCQRLAGQWDGIADLLETDGLPELPRHADESVMAAVRKLPAYNRKTSKSFGIQGLCSAIIFVIILMIRALIAESWGPAFPAQIGRWADSASLIFNGIHVVWEIAGSVFGGTIRGISTGITLTVLMVTAFSIGLAVKVLAEAVRPGTSPRLK